MLKFTENFIIQEIPENKGGAIKEIVVIDSLVSDKTKGKITDSVEIITESD